MIYFQNWRDEFLEELRCLILGSGCIGIFFFLFVLAMITIR